MHTLIPYILLIACNIVCSIILLIVEPEVISSPDDEIAIPGQVKTFSCVFKGHVLPSWMITSAGDPVTITSGQMQSFFNYPAITEIVGDGSVGTVSTLEVTADLSLNGSTYKCHISAITPVESGSATLTVFGR